MERKSGKLKHIFLSDSRADPEASIVNVGVESGGSYRYSVSSVKHYAFTINSCPEVMQDYERISLTFKETGTFAGLTARAYKLSHTLDLMLLSYGVLSLAVLLTFQGTM